MDLSLTIKLSCSLFSLRRNNMRWFNGRRILAFLVLLPLFTCLLVVNRFFMLLDYVLFPAFIKQKIKQPVFIIAAPRSATTYLFHVLAEQKEKFTAFKLWEIVFAPSVIQKYLFIVLLYFDKRIGHPLKKALLFLERKFFGRFAQIHKIGLACPEEDEAILLWNMSTIYLNFFFPDTHHFDSYFQFDDGLPPKQRHGIFSYYLNCIKRHNYVFNRKGERSFLSKNPAMMSKVKTLHSFFPDAHILNINRSPSNTIPSTIQLNNSIYAFFTSKKASKDLEQRTKSILIDWYKMSYRYLHQYYPQQVLEVDFSRLIKGEQETISRICHLLQCDAAIFLKGRKEDSVRKNHVSTNQYQQLGANELEKVLLELPFLTCYCEDILRKQPYSGTASGIYFSESKTKL